VCTKGILIQGIRDDVLVDGMRKVAKIKFLDYSIPNIFSLLYTSRFYLALQMHGANFDFMVQHFPGRERNDIKRKFKAEEKKKPEFVDKMLRERKAFDPTQFQDQLGKVVFF
jgi:hypothetical protein